MAPGPGYIDYGLPPPMNYTKIFLKHAKWSLIRPLWFKRCMFSNKLLWPGQRVMRGDYVIFDDTYPGVHQIDQRWANEKEFVIRKLRGEING